MPWPLNSIDRSTAFGEAAFGEAVYGYGKASYNEGFIIGFCTGSIITSLIYLIFKKV
jgi:hypothetical protein